MQWRHLLVVGVTSQILHLIAQTPSPPVSALLQGKLQQHLGGIMSGLNWWKTTLEQSLKTWTMFSILCVAVVESVKMCLCASAFFWEKTYSSSSRSYLSPLLVDIQTDLFQLALPVEAAIVLYFLFPKLFCSHSPWHTPPCAVLLLQVSDHAFF